MEINEYNWLRYYNGTVLIAQNKSFDVDEMLELLKGEE